MYQQETITKELHLQLSDEDLAQFELDAKETERLGHIGTHMDCYIEKGVRKVICTDISCDGMLQGPSIALYKEILEHHPELYLIASGGVSCADDIRHLEVVGIPAVIFGKALYEGRITFKELENFVS